MKIATLPLNTTHQEDGPYSREIISSLANGFDRAPGVSTARAVFTTDSGSDLEFILPLSDQLTPLDTVLDIGKTMKADFAFDGQMEVAENEFKFVFRLTDLAERREFARREYRCARPQLLHTMRAVAVDALVILGVPVDDELYAYLSDYGTRDAEAFLSYLVGRDGSTYLQTAGAKISSEFHIEDTFTQLLDALHRDPDFDEARDHLCALAVDSVYDRTAQPHDAIEALHQVIMLSSGDWKPHASLAQIYTRLGDWNNAEKNWRAALRSNRQSAELWTSLGISLLNQSRLVEAERSLMKALEYDQGENQALEHLGLCLVQMGREAEAVEYWEAALKVRPDNAVTYTNLGRAYILLEDEESAEKAFLDGLELVEDKPTIYRNYAPFLAETDRVNEALDYFELAAAHYPYDISFLIEYTNALGKAGRLSEVRPLLAQILALKPSPDDLAQAEAWLIEIDNPELFEQFKKGADEVWDGSPKKGVQKLLTVSEKMPRYWKVWHMLARGYNKLNKPALAEKAARKSLELFPSYEWAYGELTGALFEQKKFKQAYRELSLAHEDMPFSVAILCNLAMAAFYLRKRKEAVLYLEKARALAPDDEETARLIAMVKLGRR